MKKQMELPVTLIIIGLAVLFAYCMKWLNCIGGAGMLAGVILIGIGVVLYIHRLNQNSTPERIR